MPEARTTILNERTDQEKWLFTYTRGLNIAWTMNPQKQKTQDKKSQQKKIAHYPPSFNFTCFLG